MCVRMVHEIRDIEHYVEGDSLTMKFDVESLDDGLVINNLQESQIEWDLRPRNRYFDPILELSDSGVDVTIDDAVQGKFTISLSDGATDGLAGRNTQVIKITGSNGSTSTTTGKLIISGVGPS